VTFCSLKRLFSITVSFSYIYVSQGGVATQLRYGEMFNNQVTAIAHRVRYWKNFWKRSIFGKDMEKSSLAPFFMADSVYCIMQWNLKTARLQMHSRGHDYGN